MFRKLLRLFLLAASLPCHAAPDGWKLVWPDEFYGKEIDWTKRNSANAAFPAPFDQPFHLVLNVAVGGGWPGPPDDKTVFPQRMTVDWVRVYQKL